MLKSTITMSRQGSYKTDNIDNLPISDMPGSFANCTTKQALQRLPGVNAKQENELVYFTSTLLDE